MEFLLKQRLIGAAVIIALAVVFVPMLLDGSGTQHLRDIPSAPQPPASGSEPVDEDLVTIPVPTADIQLPSDSPAATVAEEGDVQIPSSEPAPPAPAPAVPAPVVRPAPASEQAAAQRDELAVWVVQVGSFSQADKAAALRDQLRKSEFKAYMEKTTGGEGRTLYRVRVGPELTRERAERLLGQLREGQKLDGFVTQHP